MADYELLFAANDAQALALMLGARQEAIAADTLAGLLAEAQIVPDEALPADRIAMNSRVTYEELPRGTRRSVSLVQPIDADAGTGRISVLSPIGLALLGRTPGVVAEPALPDGRRLRIRILEVERNSG